MIDWLIDWCLTSSEQKNGNWYSGCCVCRVWHSFHVKDPLCSFKKMSKRIVACLQGQTISSLPNSPYISRGGQRSLSRLSYFYRISRGRNCLPSASTWIQPRFFVAHLFNFLCCVFMFACLRLVSCFPSVTDVSGLSILDCPFGFYNVFQCNCYILSSFSIFAAGQLVINDKSRYNQQTNYFINSVTSTSRGFSLRHPCTNIMRN